MLSSGEQSYVTDKGANVLCGRYSLTSPLESVRQVFGFLESPNLAPRYNIAPSQEVAVVRLGEDGLRHFATLRWGLVPSWAKDVSIGNRMINARAESVAEKPAFRRAFSRRRCLVLADGFYEWRSEAGGKQPYHIARQDGAPFAFAGLWESWRPPQHQAALESCTIVTTEACETTRPIHHRMPVILNPDDFETWLAAASPPARLQALLCPSTAPLQVRRVSRRVNKVSNDDPQILELDEEIESEIDTEADRKPAQGQLF